MSTLILIKFYQYLISLVDFLVYMFHTKLASIYATVLDYLASFKLKFIVFLNIRNIFIILF